MEEVDYQLGYSKYSLEEVDTFTNEWSIHGYDQNAIAAMKALPFSRVEDYDTWFQLSGVPSEYWFSKVGDTIVAFDSTTSTADIITSQNEGGKVPKIRFRFNNGKYKIYLSKVIKLWDTRVEVDTMWDRPQRSDTLLPKVHHMIKGISMVNEGKLMDRKSIDALVSDWNQKLTKVRWVDDSSEC